VLKVPLNSNQSINQSSTSYAAEMVLFVDSFDKQIVIEHNISCCIIVWCYTHTETRIMEYAIPV